MLPWACNNSLFQGCPHSSLKAASISPARFTITQESMGAAIVKIEEQQGALQWCEEPCAVSCRAEINCWYIYIYILRWCIAQISADQIQHLTKLTKIMETNMNFLALLFTRANSFRNTTCAHVFLFHQSVAERLVLKKNDENRSFLAPAAEICRSMCMAAVKQKLWT